MSPEEIKNWKQPEMRAVTLDVTDKKLLSVLQHNCRISNKNLATFLHVSKPTVAYRIDQLEKAGVIRGYHARYRLLTENYTYIIFAFTHHQSPAREEEFLTKLTKKEGVVTAYSMSGAHRVMAVVMITASSDVNDFLDWAFAQLPIIFHETYWITQLTLNPIDYAKQKIDFSAMHWKKDTSFERDFLLPKKEGFVPTQAKDIPLMRSLYENARIPLTTLAHDTNQHASTLKRKVSDLIQGGIITKFSAQINPYAMGYDVLCILWVNVFDAKERARLKSFIARKYVSNGVMDMVGPWNLGIVLYFQSTSEQRGFENELLAQFPSIHHYQISVLRGQTAMNWFALSDKKPTLRRSVHG